MNIITVAELNQDIVNGLCKIPMDIDVIVGVPRSGMLIAALIALHMNKPLTDIDSYVNGKLYESGHTKNISANIDSVSLVKKILIVEDSSYSGRSIKEAKAKVSSINDNSVEKIFFAAYVTREAADNVDIYFRIVNPPRVFEWNFMHNTLLERACVDIDGVLCEDPTKEENDDGEKYTNFILNARPKYIPTRKIGWIVTSRLEKYREQTEIWLKKYGIEYDHLVMMNVATAEERQRLGNHARFKAEVFKKESSAIWFVESEKRQAKEIAEISGKDVFCIDSNYVYQASALNQLKGRIYFRTSAFAHKVLPSPIVEMIRNLKLKGKSGKG